VAVHVVGYRHIVATLRAKPDALTNALLTGGGRRLPVLDGERQQTERETRVSRDTSSVDEAVSSQPLSRSGQTDGLVIGGYLRQACKLVTLWRESSRDHATPIGIPPRFAKVVRKSPSCRDMFSNRPFGSKCAPMTWLFVFGS
jgi:hypothetical protein